MSDKQMVTNRLLKEISSSLEDLGGWGSIEIFVQDGKVTQITRRSIRKTERHDISQLIHEVGY